MADIRISDLTELTAVTDNDQFLVLDKDTDQEKWVGRDAIFGSLANLTDAEVTQLEAIGSTTISNTQWGYLGGLGSAPLEDSDLAANGGSVLESGSADHNSDLTNLQGGTTGEYYHLTSGEHSALTDSGDTTKVAGLNADQVDGSDVGTATNDVPTNNDLNGGGSVALARNGGVLAEQVVSTTQPTVGPAGQTWFRLDPQGSQIWSHSLHTDRVRSVFERNGVVYSGSSDNTVIAAVSDKHTYVSDGRNWINGTRLVTDREGGQLG